MAIYSTDLDSVATAEYAHLFHVLSDPTRLAIIQHLSTGRHRVTDLVSHMGFAQSTISKHLSYLLDCDLVETEVQGRSTWYSLHKKENLAVLVSAAEQLLHANGKTLSLCHHLKPSLSLVAGDQ